MPEAPRVSDQAPQAPAPGCPCCERGGWMRDLPPQAHGLALEPAGEVTHLLPPALELVAVLTSRDAGPAGGEATGPPGAWRPHAAPIGCVRLLT